MTIEEVAGEVQGTSMPDWDYYAKEVGMDDLKLQAILDTEFNLNYCDECGWFDETEAQVESEIYCWECARELDID